MRCPSRRSKATRTKPTLELSPFQAVKRDFAFVVDKAVEAGALVKAAAAADRKLITGVSVFDVFEGAVARRGQEVDRHRGRRSSRSSKTLTDEDFEALARRIVDNVGKQTGGVLRS